MLLALRLNLDSVVVSPYTVFSFIPTVEPIGRRRPRIRSVKFGDGYEQRALDGINAHLKSWDLSFQDRTTDEIDQIEAFLDYHLGITNFTWTPPSSAVAGQYVCRSWNRIPHVFDVETLTATFDEVPEL